VGWLIKKQGTGVLGKERGDGADGFDIQREGGEEFAESIKAMGSVFLS